MARGTKRKRSLYKNERSKNGILILEVNKDKFLCTPPDKNRKPAEIIAQQKLEKTNCLSPNFSMCLINIHRRFHKCFGCTYQNPWRLLSEGR